MNKKLTKRLLLSTMVLTSFSVGNAVLVQQPTAYAQEATGQNVSSKVNLTGNITNSSETPSGTVTTTSQITGEVQGTVQPGDYFDLFYQNVPAELLKGTLIKDGTGVTIGEIKVVSVSKAFDLQMSQNQDVRNDLAPRGANTLVRVVFTDGVLNRSNISFAFNVREAQTLTVVSEDKTITQGIYKGSVASPSNEVFSRELTLKANVPLAAMTPRVVISPNRDIAKSGETYTPSALTLTVVADSRNSVPANSLYEIELAEDSSILFNQNGLQASVGSEFNGVVTRTYYNTYPSNANDVVVYPMLENAKFELVSATDKSIVFKNKSDLNVNSSYAFDLRNSFLLKDTATFVNKDDLNYTGVNYTNRITNDNGLKLENFVTNAKLNIFESNSTSAATQSYGVVAIDYLVKEDPTIKVSGSEFVLSNTLYGTSYDGTSKLKTADVVWANGRTFRPTGENLNLKGVINAPRTTVTQYFTEVKGSVKVQLIDDEDNSVIKEDVLMTNSSLGVAYSSTPEETLEVNGVKYKLKEIAQNKDGRVVEGETLVKHVYTKAPKVTVPVPFETVYVPDKTLPTGTTEIKVPGVNGEKEENGTIITPPTTQVIHVGVQPKVEPIPFEITYVKDETKPVSYREVTTKGVEGERTTTYQVDPKTGEVTELETTITKNKIDEVVTVGAGKEVKEIPYETSYITDKTKPITYREIVTKGVIGKEVTVHEVDPKTGEVTSTKTMEIEKVDEVITIGTKKETPKQEVKEELPKTGETQSFLSVIGLSMISVAGFLFGRKRQ